MYENYLATNFSSTTPFLSSFKLPFSSIEIDMSFETLRNLSPNKFCYKPVKNGVLEEMDLHELEITLDRGTVIAPQIFYIFDTGIKRVSV